MIVEVSPRLCISAVVERDLSGSRLNALRRNDPSRRGMSLIELLVVLAILALTAAVMLPALSQARQAGRSSVCLAALRCAGLAAQLYADDNDGYFWPYFTDIAGADGGRRWWFGFEPGGPAATGGGRHRTLDRSSGFLSKYLTATLVDLRCPSFPYASGKFFPKFSPEAGGFGYNAAALAGVGAGGASSGGPRKMQDFAAESADVFVLADGVHFDRLDHSAGSIVNQPFNEPAYIEWQEPSLFSRNAGVNGGFGHFRHNGLAQSLYIDGHAAGQPPRRPLHPYSAADIGPVANLSDDALRTVEVRQGRATFHVDRIYGLR